MPRGTAGAAVHGWLWFMDGALTDWLEHRDLERPQLLGLLLGTLHGAVVASGAPGVVERLSAPPLFKPGEATDDMQEDGRPDWLPSG